MKWHTFLSWITCIILSVTTFFIYRNKTAIKNNLTQQIATNEILESQRAQLQSNLIDKKLKLNFQNKVIAFISLEKTIKINLTGQKIAPNSFANVYWNKQKGEMFIDLNGLPTTPKGKVYQLWSLTLTPLTPTSLGTLDDYNKGQRFIKVINQNKSQAFGITLEAEGGNKLPTLKQLYTLGILKTS